MLRII
ncbi:hypothetical protein LINGRAHAP2_LOCUS24757 [Linum grandiflorum]|jgi:hypothetical protein